MPHDPSLATGVRSETAAPYATTSTASPPPATLLARIERAGPAALDDHELLGLLGIDVDIATLAAVGGLREFLDDPDDRLRTFLSPAEDRARVHALHELHARWMEARLRGLRNEVFGVIHLDNRHQPILAEHIFQDTIDGATVHPRVVVRRAMMHNAAACTRPTPAPVHTGRPMEGHAPRRRPRIGHA